MAASSAADPDGSLRPHEAAMTTASTAVAACRIRVLVIDITNILLDLLRRQAPIVAPP
jgi:hypothetical protein